MSGTYKGVCVCLGGAKLSKVLVTPMCAASCPNLRAPSLMLGDDVPPCSSRFLNVGAMLHAVHMCPLQHEPTHSLSTPRTHWNQTLRPKCPTWCWMDALQVAVHESKPFVRSRASFFCIPIDLNLKQKRVPPYLRPHLAVCYDSHMAVIPSSSRSRPC